jgi:hypothetical protein
LQDPVEYFAGHVLIIPGGHRKGGITKGECRNFLRSECPQQSCLCSRTANTAMYIDRMMYMFAIISTSTRNAPAMHAFGLEELPIEYMAERTVPEVMAQAYVCFQV